MDGNTPVNVDLPQFTQREASEVSGAEMKSINNLLDRGFFALTPVEDRRLAGRRLFSIRNIVFLKAMQHCSERLGLPPSLASLLAHKTANELGSWPGKTEDGKHYRIWYLAYKAIAADVDVAEDGGWHIQPVWQNPTSGILYQYQPSMFGEEDNALPLLESAFIVFPASRLGNTTFLQCCKLLNEDPEAPDPTEGTTDDF